MSISWDLYGAGLTARMDEWKTDLWNLAGIPSPPNDHETNETIVFGYIVAWFLGEVSQKSGNIRGDLTRSSPHVKPTRPSSPTSMNGKLVWLSPFAESATSMLRPSSRRTLLCSVVTCVLEVSTSTTTCSTSMSITRRASEVSTTGKARLFMGMTCGARLHQILH